MFSISNVLSSAPKCCKSANTIDPQKDELCDLQGQLNFFFENYKLKNQKVDQIIIIKYSLVYLNVQTMNEKFEKIKSDKNILKLFLGVRCKIDICGIKCNKSRYKSWSDSTKTFPEGGTASSGRGSELSGGPRARYRYEERGARRAIRLLGK